MINFQGKEYACESGESVLDCLLRQEVPAPYSCRSGVCQSCMMQAKQGTPNPESQKGLKPSLISQNYFLSCMCSAEQDMEVVLPDSESFRITTKVLSVDALTDTITRLRLHRPRDYDYHAGQYINLYNPQGVGRNYSLASMPILDPFLELHVKLVPNGLISTWVHKDIKVGQEVTIGPAIGTNFYVGDKKDQPIILIGTSTGLAPLYGIVRDALHHGHSGEIRLYHGSATNAGIYLMQELQQLDENHSNFEYYPCVSKESPRSGGHAGRALDLALQHNKNLSGWRAFICGDPDVVKATSKALFLAGISLQEIYLDPFLPSKPV